ncbi:YVTN family beta-propeller protein [Paraburkholderia youngii]
MRVLDAPLLLALGLVASVPSAAAAENVIVLNSADANVSLIDDAILKVVDTVAVGNEPHHLMATPDNQSLIVSNAVGISLV